MNWYIEVLRKYAIFDGRARRKEYWMFVLFNLIVFLALIIVENIIGITTRSGFGFLSALYGLVSLIPSIAVSVRRLHDTSHSGWWLLIGLVPLIGSIVLFVFYVQDSHPDNQYGPNPKQVTV